ncbi:hypothetical protein OZN62_08240 [Aurantiacibacter sp. MUD11]|uniref:hypothetical protein n=1 Tax=Aurantiacibacter sp. MUD11 TaxID=3003265 RepID=UPI0022AA0B9C|nr:hypothetical protein [Aurantiacibacter sp. MUD11]WAT16929.1 hypothetical protein OZN62_08240 [Aurantiacibacter sp. MUD11]
MKKLTIAALAATVLAAAPAQAQSAFVMIIGEAPAPAADRADAPVSREAMIESAVERACPQPFIRDLKARSLLAECKAEARAEAEALVAERAATAPVLAVVG